MKSTKLNPDASAKPYKKLLISAMEMRGESGLKAFDRAQILCTVFDDREFRADHQNFDDFQAADILNIYCDDLALSFLELRTLLKHRPERSQWKDGKLATMYDSVFDEIQSNEEEAPKSGITRRRATLADLQASNAERDKLRSENANLKLQVEANERRIQELELDRQGLRESLARLEGRLQGLESGRQVA